MVRLRSIFFAGLLCTGIISGAVRATVHNITLTNFSISPQNTVVFLGDTVKWTVGTGFHTSTSDVTSPKQWISGTLSGGGANFSLIVSLTDSTGDYPYTCEFHPGTMIDTLRVMAPPVSCCIAPIRGDANSNGALNVLDLNYLVAFFFSGGPVPPCNQEADVNGNGALNVLDLNALVAYFFSAGPSPAACP